MSERKYSLNHSSRSAQITRVKSRKDKPKITVGLTISPNLLAEARNRNLNLSRILEQALQSILEYVQPQTETESSNISYSRFFSERNSWAGSLARLGHPLDVRKVTGSNPVRPTKTNKNVGINQESIRRR